MARPWTCARVQNCAIARHRPLSVNWLSIAGSQCLLHEVRDLLGTFLRRAGLAWMPACASGVLRKCAALLGVQLRHALQAPALSKRGRTWILLLFWLHTTPFDCLPPRVYTKRLAG